MSLCARALVLSSLLCASAALGASRSARPPPAAPVKPPLRSGPELSWLSQLPRLRTQLESLLEDLGAMERHFAASVGSLTPPRSRTQPELQAHR